MPETCTCIDDIDAKPQMVEATAHCVTNLIGNRRVTIATSGDRKIRGKRPPVIIASFCPFCGVKYPPHTMRVTSAEEGREDRS